MLRKRVWVLNLQKHWTIETDTTYTQVTQNMNNLTEGILVRMANQKEENGHFLYVLNINNSVSNAAVLRDAVYYVGKIDKKG